MMRLIDLMEFLIFMSGDKVCLVIEQVSVHIGQKDRIFSILPMKTLRDKVSFL